MEFEWVNNDHNTSVYCLNNPDIVKSLTSDTYLLHASPQQPDDIYRTLILVLTIPIAILDILGFIIFIALHNNYLLIKVSFPSNAFESLQSSSFSVDITFHRIQNIKIKRVD